MRFGPIEIGPDAFGFNIFPVFFSHKNVSYDDQFADEVGAFWLGMRISIFYNVMTWQQMNERRSQR